MLEGAGYNKRALARKMGRHIGSVGRHLSKHGLRSIPLWKQWFPKKEHLVEALSIHGYPGAIARLRMTGSSRREYINVSKIVLRACQKYELKVVVDWETGCYRHPLDGMSDAALLEVYRKHSYHTTNTAKSLGLSYSGLKNEFVRRGLKLQTGRTTYSWCKESLHELHVNRRLGIATIAKIYGATPGGTLYALQRFGIDRVKCPSGGRAHIRQPGTKSSYILIPKVRYTKKSYKSRGPCGYCGEQILAAGPYKYCNTRKLGTLSRHVTCPDWTHEDLGSNPNAGRVVDLSIPEPVYKDDESWEVAPV